MVDENDDKDDEHDYAAPLLKLKTSSTFIRQAMLALPSWITPNGVTVFRTLLIVPAVALLLTDRYWSAIITLTVAMLLDFVDGALAVARNEQSETGAFLDPLADKILIGGALVTVAARLPWYFAPVIAFICILAVALTVARLRRMSKWSDSEPHASAVAADVSPPKHPIRTVAASAAGKLKLVAEAVGTIAVLVSLAIPSTALSWAAFAVLIVAVWYGFKSFLGQARS